MRTSTTHVRTYVYATWIEGVEFLETGSSVNTIAIEIKVPWKKCSICEGAEVGNDSLLWLHKAANHVASKTRLKLQVSC